ncbi:MAG TPA: hypothetical protein VED19_01290 [Candidatus Nitrosopolaris sp.]|nr:hypothetical protein [Candidatus Nitrosopolaris sp.]
MKNARKLAKNTGRNVAGPWKSAGPFWKLLRFWIAGVENDSGATARRLGNTHLIKLIAV